MMLLHLRVELEQFFQLDMVVELALDGQYAL